MEDKVKEILRTSYIGTVLDEQKATERILFLFGVSDYYRLVDGDTLKEGDEYYDYSHQWQEIENWEVGDIYNIHTNWEMRRKVNCR